MNGLFQLNTAFNNKLNEIPVPISSANRPTWDETFMNFCETLAKRSTCLRLQTASILVKECNVLSIGYNGCVSKMEHCTDFWRNEYNTKYKHQGSWEEFIKSPYFYDEHHKYSTRNELHGESNAIVNAARNNISSENSTMYTLYAPCINCAKLIVSSRVKKVVFRELYKRDNTGIEFLQKNKVIVVQI